MRSQYKILAEDYQSILKKIEVKTVLTQKQYDQINEFFFKRETFCTNKVTTLPYRD
jgi:hypothetical protein